MTLKRGVWVAAALGGVVVFGGIAVLSGYEAYVSAGEDGIPSLGALDQAIQFILMAAACGGALFFSPRDIEAVTKEEVDEDPAQWIKDMRKQSETNEQK